MGGGWSKYTPKQDDPTSLAPVARPLDTQPPLLFPLTEYQEQVLKLWESCQINLSYANEVIQIASQIMANKNRYDVVGQSLQVPFWVIGCIHYREPDPPFNFVSHLANGDPLFDENGKPIATTHVPKGLGPFLSWESAATAALLYEGWDLRYRWDIASALDYLERYNGPGYKNRDLNSPYIWSGTNHYEKGKYAADGIFDPNLVDQQMGCAAIAMALKSMGVEI